VPEVTQTRDSPWNPTSWVHVPGYRIFSSRFSDMTGWLDTPTQTTTSFRTGSKWDDSDDDIPDSANQAAFRKWLRKNERNQNWSNPYDTGHEFYTRTQKILLSHDGVPFFHPQYGTIGVGPLAPELYGLSDGLFVNPSEPDQGFYGPTAIKRARPTSPHENLAVALAELKSEGIPAMEPSLVQQRAGLARSAQAAGQDWLALQFGWRPLLSDIRKTGESVFKARSLLEQFHRDAGKPIRRRVDFPLNTTTTHKSTQSGYMLRPSNTTEWDGVFVDGSYGLSGRVSISDKTTQSVWFSGSFSYASSVSDGIIGKLKGIEQDVNHLFGTRVTPEVLWNLTPWSWLSDWTNTLGTTISNASALQDDGLVLRYGYLMMHSIRDRTVTISGPRTVSGLTGPYSCTLRTEVKRRVKASPYGFGLNPQSFSLKQWSILAALGLARGIPGNPIA